MALPVWPVSVPYRPTPGSIQGAAPTPNALVTTFEDGNQRSRPRSLTFWTEMSMTIEMTNAEYGVLEDFFKNTLGNQAARFTMPIWRARDHTFPDKEVRAVEGLPVPQPIGVTHVAVPLKVKVKNL